MDMDSSSMPMVISILVIGSKIKQRVSGNIKIQMDQFMKETGFKTYSMVKELRHGLMEQYLKEAILMVRSKDTDNLNGQMVQFAREISLIIVFMARQSIPGLMAESMMGAGQ